MSDLDLQKEILAAVEAKDDAALEAIAVRHGVDPNLWRYSQGMFLALSELGKIEREFAEAVTKSVQTLEGEKP